MGLFDNPALGGALADATQPQGMLSQGFSGNPDRSKVMQILNANNGKLFVDRIINRAAYPTLDLGQGQFATHKMAWTDADGKYRVYPTVQYINGQMVDLGPEQGLQHAMKANDYIDFDSPEEADWFSQKYKSVWGQ